MKHTLRTTGLLWAGLAAGSVLAGCGVSSKTIENYSIQLRSLEEKGVPDSILSSVRVHLSQVINGKKSGLGTVVRTSSDSVKHYLAAAEQWYENWYMQAQMHAEHLDTVMKQLLIDERNVKKVDAQIRGTTWNMTKKITGGGANAVQKNRVSFRKDGTYEMSEEMKGRTKPMLKEDWHYLTWGTYTIKGDTILLSTKREKRVRQNYVHLSGRKEVRKIQDKPYDSTITDGSKDRFFTFEYLKENFRK
jgi:hypothetical protein